MSEAQKRLNNLHQILSRSLKFQPALPTTASSLPSSQTSLSSSATASSVEVQTITPCHGCSLTVTPAVGQFDQPVRIWVGGLPSHTRVTLQGWSRSRWRGTEVVLVSHGHFYTDQQGNLDLDKDPSLGGTYTGRWVWFYLTVMQVFSLWVGGFGFTLLRCLPYCYASVLLTGWWVWFYLTEVFILLLYKCLAWGLVALVLPY